MALYQTGTGLAALVGIGTTNPTSNLHVVGNVLATNFSGTYYGPVVGANTVAASTIYGPIAGSNTIAASSLTLGTALAVASGGTGVTTSTGSGNVVLSAGPSLTGTTSIATLNLTNALAVVYGGTGTTTSTGLGNVVLSAGPSLTGTTSIATLNLTNALAVVYGGTGTTTSTGSGNNVLSAGPSLTGTTSIATLNLTNALAVVYGGTGTTTSTGSGNVVLSANPTFTGTASIATLNLTNALAVASGGTGLTTLTSGGLIYASGTTTLASSGAYTANQILYGGGAGAAPGSSSLVTFDGSTLRVTSTDVNAGVYAKRFYVQGVGDNTDTPSTGDNAGGPWYGLGYSVDTGLTSYLQLANYNGISFKSSSGIMVFQPNGNVGIGVTNPSNPLSVSGSASIGTYATTAAPSNGLIVSGNVGIGLVNPTKPLVVVRPGAGGNNPAIMIANNGSGQGLRFQTYDLTADGQAFMGLGTDMGPGSYEHSLVFPYGGSGGKQTIGSYDGTTYSTKMTILANGNVGIGTVSPGYTLDVAGNFRTTGTVSRMNRHEAYSSVYGSSYYQAPIEVREYNLEGSAGTEQARYPRIGFHHAGVVASSIAMEPSGRICIFNNPGNAYEAFAAGRIRAEGRAYFYGTGLAGGGENTFAGLAAENSDNGRAQVILNSSYSDMIISSSQGNGTHGSTVSFVANSPANNDYRKFVINVGGWAGYGSGGYGDRMSFGWQNAAYGNPHLYVAPDNSTLMLDGRNKRVGINNVSSPQAPLHVQSSDIYFYFPAGYGAFYLGQSGFANFSGPFYATIGICAYFQGGRIVVGGEVDTLSDVRKKTNIKQLNSSLENIMKVKIVSYTLIDGGDKEIGVIAQELNNIYPDMVKKNGCEFLPTHLCRCKCVELRDTHVYIQCDKYEDFKTGDTIRLYSNKSKYEVEVVKTDSEGFYVDKFEGYDTVGGLAIYGKKHNDVQLVTKNSLFMAHIKATQELTEKVSTLESEVLSLEARLERLEKLLGTQ